MVTWEVCLGDVPKLTREAGVEDGLWRLDDGGGGDAERDRFGELGRLR